MSEQSTAGNTGQDWTGGSYQWQPVWPAPPPPPPPRRPGRATAVALTCCLAIAALGAPLGLLWAALAPSVPVRMTDDGALLADTQPEQFIAADGWFSLLGLIFGMLAAVAVWVLFRNWRGPMVLIAVTAGCVGAGLLAWWLGSQLGAGEYDRLLHSAAVGRVFGKPPDLRAAETRLLFGFIPVVRGDVLAPGFGAAVAYTLLAGWSRFASLRPGEEPELDPELTPPAMPGLPPDAAGLPPVMPAGPGFPPAAPVGHGLPPDRPGLPPDAAGLPPVMPDAAGLPPVMPAGPGFPPAAPVGHGLPPDRPGLPSDAAGLPPAAPPVPDPPVSSDSTGRPAPPAAPAPPASGEAAPPPG